MIRVKDIFSFGEKEDKRRSQQGVMAEVPDAVFEYAEGSDSYKKLVEWIIQAGGFISIEDFEEGLKWLPQLEQPTEVFAKVLSSREREDVARVEDRFFNWERFEFNKFNWTSYALRNAIMEMPKQFDRMRFLGRLYNQNKTVGACYHANGLHYRLSLVDDSTLQLFDDQEKAIVEAAVESRSSIGPNGFYYTTLFPTFSESSHFLPSLEGIDDNGIVSMINRYSSEIPGGCEGRRAYLNFLLDIKDKVTAGTFEHIDAAQLDGLITGLSATVLKKDFFDRGVEKLGKTVQDGFNSADKEMYKKLFERLDAAIGDDTHALMDAFNSCVAVQQMSIDTLAQCAYIDQQAAQQKSALRQSLSTEEDAAQKILDKALKIR